MKQKRTYSDEFKAKVMEKMKLYKKSPWVQAEEWAIQQVEIEEKIAAKKKAVTASKPVEPVKEVKVEEKPVETKEVKTVVKSKTTKKE